MGGVVDLLRSTRPIALFEAHSKAFSLHADLYKLVAFWTERGDNKTVPAPEKMLVNSQSAQKRSRGDPLLISWDLIPLT